MSLGKAPADSTRCCELVHDNMRGPSFHQCYRKVKVTRGGAGYCTQHDPERVKAHRDAGMAWHNYDFATREWRDMMIAYALKLGRYVIEQLDEGRANPNTETLRTYYKEYKSWKSKIPRPPQVPRP